MKLVLNTKKLVSLCAFVFLVSIFATFSVSANSARDAVNSVVMVYAEYEASVDGEATSQAGWGSGFAIGAVGKPIQYIVTNYHVVKDANENNGVVQVYFSAAANKYVQAEIYWKNEDKDLAILKLPEATTERKAMVIRMNKDLDYEDTYSALGYPGDATLLNTLPKFDQTDITITRGGISKATRLSETDLYLLDLKIEHGNSGGPLVNSKGQVVGINTLKFTSSDGAVSNYAIQIDELVRNVDRSVIPLTIYPEITQVMVIYMILGALAFILIIIIIILVIKKSKKTIASPIHENVTNNQVYHPQAETSVKPVNIIGISGHFGGQKFKVDNRLIIGRDNNKCNLFFPIDQPGISGTHCEITTDTNGVYIKDLGSSYGTYFASGAKLTPNQPVALKNGDIFYLADEDNKFEVRIG